MDVSIKLSLSGGHSWEFVCDEDDPLVMGVVSALPGATVDANLPADGLVQVESRSGERLFFSRGALVCVSIRRLPPNASGAVAVPPSAPAFLLLPEALPAEAAASVLALPELEGRGPLAAGSQDDIDPAVLPDDAVGTLIAVAAQAASAFAVAPDGPTYLDLRLVRVAAGASLALRRRDDAAALLDLVVVLDAGEAIALRVPGKTDGGPGSGAGRTLTLMARDILLVPATPGEVAIRPAGLAAASITLLAGSLCRGSHLGAA